MPIANKLQLAYGQLAQSIFIRKVFFAGLLLLGVQCSSYADSAEPVLRVFDGRQEQVFSRAQLLAHTATRELVLSLDVAYQQPRTVKAIPVRILLPHLAELESLQFVALDGFVANIPANLLDGAGQAFVAIEPENEAWPALKKGSAPTAGPFYLVWLTPEKAQISSEQWPYQIARIAAAAPLSQRYPQLLPKSTGSELAQGLRGFQVYVANCAVCHQLNAAGDASIGPDLNRPYSPVEYFNSEYLRKLIREPGAVRSWKASVMPGFGRQAIPDASLDDLLVYFKLMAQQRK
ncbi:c-type cytochrome [Undibacterium sp. Ren11W]|uniref:c-type cytochrome n=1 Tax=Undibacterium sp. Ren11W TaxID=3413045 RepID=UPI003BF26593